MDSTMDSDDSGANRILFVSDLPGTATKDAIHALFDKFEGLTEVWLRHPLAQTTTTGAPLAFTFTSLFLPALIFFSLFDLS